jgi:hypothetical protein
MKLLCSFMLLLATAFVVSSCQKELSFEAGLAKGTLAKDALGDCMPITVTGSYQKDTLLKTTTNYVDVQVNITQTGSYSIKTDTLNGYSFSAAGFISVPGLNTVRLLANGRPVAPALDVFTVRYDSSVCQFDIVVTGAGGGGGGTNAVFTLTGSPTTCTGATQTNNFFATLPTSAANTVTINADVTVAGSYTIQATTTPANGLTFSASGNLAVGTNQPIVLQAVGTASTAGSIPYTLSTTTPASNCGFNLTVQAAPTPATYTFECPSNPTFTGTYQAGVSTAGNTITINVTSLAGGSYTINTNTTASSNGVTYGGSGVLIASPNPQSVTLSVLGTPTAAGTFTYTLTGTGVASTCTFSQTYTPATSNGTISFNIGTVVKTFNFVNSADTSVQAAPPPLPPGNFFLLSIEGNATASTTQETFFLDIAKQAPYFSNGSTYNVNQFLQFILLDIGYTDNTGVDYTASTDGTTQIPAFSVTITNITATQVTGTFTGPLKNAAGATITVTNGAFSLPLQ